MKKLQNFKLLHKCKELLLLTPFNLCPFLFKALVILSILIIYSLYNKIRNKGKIVSAGYWEGGDRVCGKGGGGGMGEKWPKPCMHIWIIKEKGKKKRMYKQHKI
jgi:hypothetical protein